MRCSDFQQTIDLYLDEALATSDRAAFESHVRGCPSCEAKLEHARLLMQTFREMPEQVCPERVVSRIFAETGTRGFEPVKERSFAQALQEFFRGLSPRPALTGWALMMLLFIGSYFLSRRTEQIEPVNYTAAELRQTRAQVDYAFNILFQAVRKTEKLAREEVFQSKFIQPVKSGLSLIYEPLSSQR
jgi:hypothetical protein